MLPLYICFAILMLISFIAAAAEDEGTLGYRVVGNLFAKLFWVLRFPTHIHLGLCC